MSNPMIQLIEALEAARRAKDPGADWLNLITVDAEGFPVARILTIRGISEESVVVTINRRSPKMEQLEHSGRYEAHLFWPNVLGQVRMRGAYRVEDPPELAQGWRGRAYGGKIIDLYQVHCRPQSSVVASREVLLEELAKLLKGAMGASRPPCDNGWVPDTIQVGLTGKIIAPEVYIAVAISGSSQHMSGCSSAKNIIAINKDAEANIFREARFGVVGDWKKVLPAFTEKVKELLAA